MTFQRNVIHPSSRLRNQLDCMGNGKKGGGRDRVWFRPNRNGDQGYWQLKGHNDVFVTGERQFTSGPQYCFSSPEGMGLGERRFLSEPLWTGCRTFPSYGQNTVALKRKIFLFIPISLD
jgi:hypothetical protein